MALSKNTRMTRLAASASLVVTLACGAGCDNVAGSGPTPDTIDPNNPGNPRPSRDPIPFAPADARLRRLLAFQYRNAVRDLLGEGAAAVVDPPADVPLNGFVSVGSATLSMSPTDIEKLEASAYAAAQVAVHGAPQSWRTCEPVSFDDGICAEEIVANFGRKAFRRPLTTDERARWTGIAMQGAQAYGDFDMGLEFAVAGMLQSPNFIYLVEEGQPGGDPDERPLTGLEMASRLSFFLAGTTPSDELLDAAERGDLDTVEGVRVHAQALLEGPQAKAALREFFEEKLGFGQLDVVARPDVGLTNSVRDDMKDETLHFIDDIVWDRNADARELFSANFTYVNDELADFYGLPLPGQGAQMVRVELDASSDRAGLLTQGAFLARFAHEKRSSPTLRGKFIRESIMCQAVPAPPNDVNTTLPEPTAQDLPQTTRDRMEVHMTEARCAGCHAMMDPLGFALEGFDQAGRARTHEFGLPINTSTDVDGVEVQNARELGKALAEYPDVPTCLIKNLFRHGTGHIEDRAEDPSLDLVSQAFEDSGFRLKEALLEIAVSDAFRLVARPEGAP
jgi:hypothetical protein